MSEKLIQERMQTLLQALTELDDAAVTIGDYRILDRGHDNMAVIQPGTVRPDFTADLPGETLSLPCAGIEMVWTEYIDVFRRFRRDEASWTAFRDLRQSVVDMILAYPSLNNLAGCTYFRLGPVSNDPEGLYDSSGDGPFFLTQRIVVEAAEMVVQTTGEYA